MWHFIFVHFCRVFSPLLSQWYEQGVRAHNSDDDYEIEWISDFKIKWPLTREKWTFFRGTWCNCKSVNNIFVFKKSRDFVSESENASDVIDTGLPSMVMVILVPSLNSIEIDLVFQFIDKFHRKFLYRLSFWKMNEKQEWRAFCGGQWAFHLN